MIKEMELLRDFVIDRHSMEEKIALHAHAEILLAGYAKANVPVPEWLADASKQLTEAIKAERRGNIERQLTLAKKKQEGLMSTEDKRQKAAQEVADLEAQLAAG